MTIKVLDEGREKTKRRVEWWTAEELTYFTENGDGEFCRKKLRFTWAVTALLDGAGIMKTYSMAGGACRLLCRLGTMEKELTDLQLVNGVLIVCAVMTL